MRLLFLIALASSATLPAVVDDCYRMFTQNIQNVKRSSVPATPFALCVDPVAGAGGAAVQTNFFQRRSIHKKTKKKIDRQTTYEWGDDWTMVG